MSIRQWLVQVTIHEASQLLPKKSNGASDPVVNIKLGGQHKTTTRKKDVTSGCFWNETFVFEKLQFTERDMKDQKILLEVQNANPVFRNDMIGEFVFDMGSVHIQPDHEYYKQWVPLTIPANPSKEQGFLKVSIFVIGENDTPPFHDLNDNADEGGEAMSLKQVIQAPPALQRTFYHLFIKIMKVEDLPKMDVVGWCDPYITVTFANNTLKSEVHKNVKRVTLNSKFRIPLTTPIYEDAIALRLWDEDQFQKDDVIAIHRLSFAAVRNDTFGPCWINLYGSNPEESSLFADLPPDIEGNWYLGRMLVGANVERVETLSSADVMEVEPSAEPETTSFIFRMDVYECSELAGGWSSVMVEARMGPHVAQTSWVSSEGEGMWTFNNNEGRIKDLKVTMPKADAQRYDLIVSIWGRSLMNKGRIGYLRFAAKHIPQLASSAPNPIWWQLNRLPFKKVSDQVVGYVLFSMELGEASTGKMRPSRKKIKKAEYQLRAHIFEGRGLPAADTNGLSDPYVVVSVAGKKIKSSTKKETLNPTWYETKVMNLSLLSDLSLAPPITITAFDEDEFFNPSDLLGRTFYSLSAVKAQKAGLQPKWLTLKNPKDDGVSCGQILVAFELLTPPQYMRPLPRTLKPLTRKVTLMISLLGLRDLISYRFMDIAHPSVVFDCCGKTERISDFEDEGWATSGVGMNFNYVKVLKMELDIPSQALYRPVLNVVVMEAGKLWGESVVAATSISLLPFMDWLPEEERQEPENYDDIEMSDSQAELMAQVRSTAKEESQQDESFFDLGQDQGDQIALDIEDCNVRPMPLFVCENSRSGGGNIQIIGKRTIPYSATQGWPGSADEAGGDRSQRFRVEGELEHSMNTVLFKSYKLFRGDGEDRKVAGFVKLAVRVIDLKTGNPGKILHPEDAAAMDAIFNQEALKQMVSKIDLRARIYMIRGEGLTPKDVTGASDPYLILRAGDADDKHLINDRNHALKKTLTPDFYHCFEMDCALPRYSRLQIEVFDEDLVTDELIGLTVIDLEDRWLSPEWQRFREKPTEFRTLRNPAVMVPQGKVEMWVDLLPVADALSIPAEILIKPEPEPFEIRVVIWDTKKVPLVDGTSVDIFVTGELATSAGFNGGEPERQSTDVHMGSEDGHGEFQWRFIWSKVLFPAEAVELRIGVWDFDLLAPNDAIGEVNLNLKGLLSQTKKAGMRQSLGPDWIRCTHPSKPGADLGEVKLEIHVLPQSEANQNKVGRERTEPNRDPTLVKPTAGRDWSDMVPGAKALLSMGNFFRRLKMLCCFGVLAVVGFVLFVIPGYLR
eukprot:GILJ01007013.1.p1 GENE.GILJ01007013.1~~GILJ01007013.1.p1  ORF type:complete len:1298 (-),score=199.01 GILJ01007013.1:115-4008(-)